LSLLLGRLPPSDVRRWRDSSIAQIAAYVDGQPAADLETIRKPLRARISGFGVALSPADVDTIDRFHRTFMGAGLNLRFQSFGRPPRAYYPTFRDLLLATDANGRMWNYLAREDAFQFVKALQARDGIIPIVGNVAGAHSMKAIADTVAARGSRVSAFYISNVETYLRGVGERARFVENVRRLPHDGRSVMIRAVFGGNGASTSLVEPFFASPSP
jgi:hypothetical protein